MRSWENRSYEEANLFNPAFLAIIAYQCVKGYEGENVYPAPYILPFLVTPFILHKDTRAAMPHKINSTFSTWISQPEGTLVKAGYSERARAISPYVKEALMFSFSHHLLKISDNNYYLRCSSGVTIPITEENRYSQEVMDCFKKSLFCGRWFARGGKIETIMALLGVQP